ncbi:MAG: hypothetical protein JSR73_14900 [Proteobacteria bacterium]|nr:hypothetical protein [Pseudomonadota bacterium]
MVDGIHDGVDGGAYLAEAVLDPGALESIREANIAFLELVAGLVRRRPGSPAYGLGPRTAGAVARLDALGLRAAASCPYTLFDLRFDDAAFWDGVARAARAPGPGLLGDEATFGRTAVFLAWHLARSSELKAALVLGMSAKAYRTWLGLPLAVLDHAGSLALPTLSARWGSHPRFWPRLLEAVSPVDAVRAGTVRQLGLQLLAADGIGKRAPDLAS